MFTETCWTTTSALHMYRQNSGLIWNIKEYIPLKGKCGIHPLRGWVIPKERCPITSLSQKGFFTVTHSTSLYANN